MIEGNRNMRHIWTHEQGASRLRISPRVAPTSCPLGASGAVRQNGDGEIIRRCHPQGVFSCRVLLLGRLISLIDNARWKCGGFDEFQTDMLSFGEQSLANAKHKRIYMQGKLIHQVVLDQIMGVAKVVG